MDSLADKDYYELLGVPKNASVSQIKKKYRDLMRKYHPDKLPDAEKEFGEKMTKAVNEAWTVLKDEKKRKKYDKYGKKGLNGEMPDMDDFPFPFPFPGMRQRRRNRVPPVQVQINLTLEDIFNGKILEQEIERYTLCGECDMTGFADKQKHDCKGCNGKGRVIIRRQIGPGMIQQMEQPCQKCQGSGRDTQSPLKCKVCNGNQVTRTKKVIKVEIPKGLKDGEVIQLENEGNEIPLDDREGNGVTRGHVHLIINEVEHSLFKRGIVINGKMDPSNICIVVDLSFEDSIVGFKKMFKHLDGRKVYISETKIVQDGDNRVIIGEGLPVKNKEYKRGDLFVKYNVSAPTQLDDDQKKAIYKIITGKDYVEEEPNEEYTQLNLFDVDSYQSSSNHAYDSDSDDGHGQGAPECHVQ